MFALSGDAQYRAHIPQMLAAWERALRTADRVAIADIKDTHYALLLRTNMQLRGLAAQDPDIRGYLDRIYNNLLRWDPRAPRGITRLFTEFIKGITYFADQETSAETPVYHRLFSCGPKGDPAYRENHLVCLEGLTARQRMARRPLIERCYIERLIYDALFQHENVGTPVSRSDVSRTTVPHHDRNSDVEYASQDEGHLFRLDLTRRDFETCFPEIKIDLEVQYNDGFPTGVTIVRMFKDRGALTIERYDKPYAFSAAGVKVYEGFVACTRELSDGRSFFKVQHFDGGERQWVPLSDAAVGTTRGNGAK